MNWIEFGVLASWWMSSSRNINLALKIDLALVMSKVVFLKN